jgi:heat-inducible transcriptional repressor
MPRSHKIVARKFCFFTPMGVRDDREVLSSRKLEVLRSIVQAYIETGEPVASRSIARQRRDSLSPASIRNVMADLDDEGYLKQPHTSAGRVPTEKAFRLYVQSLSQANRLLGSELSRIKNELRRIERLEDRVEHSSHLLTEMTKSVGIAAAIPASSQTLDQVDLLALGDRRVLMIVVTRDHQVHNKLVLLDEMVTQDELHSIRNYLNMEFGGWVLSEIRAELKKRLEAEAAAYDRMLKQLTDLYAKGLLAVETSPDIYLDGASNLVGLDLHLTKEKLRELFRALEEKKKILALVDRFLELPAGELAVHVGLGDDHPAMSELSLIGVPVTLPNGLSAVVAVLGPMRMDYSRVMSAVLHVAQAFEGTALE